MASNKPKISSLVSAQFPEFVREDYQTFVSFVEAYYEYLETQVITDFQKLGDIDNTLDSFIRYFKSELALNFPTTLVDDRFLLPKIKELYISKGTEASYKLLFRLLYNKEIEVLYPATQMLRVSDGKWIQRISVFAQVNVGLPENVLGKTINIVSTDRNNLKKIQVFIDSYEPTAVAGIYEFFLLSGFTGTFNIGDLLNYSTIFTGVIIATTSTLRIDQPGKNFKVGQTYDIVGSGSGSVIKIESVDSQGGIKVAKFINFGIGYPTSFTTSILATTNLSALIQNYFTITGSSPSLSATISDSIDQLTDQGLLSFYNYASTPGSGLYVDGTYVGSIVRSFANAPSKAIVDPTDYAIISIQLGSIAKYPGYYKNSDGFLDDTIYVQDSKYYQAFSYVIQLDKIFESYKSIIKNLVHPTGTELFGEYNIDNIFDINSTIGTISVSSLDRIYNVITQSSDQIITEDGNTLVTVV
jgi:hypothetical protein